MMTSHWSNTVLQSTTKAPSNYFWINIFINTTTASQAQLFNIIFTHNDTLFNTCLNPATVHQSNISPSAHFKRRDKFFSTGHKATLDFIFFAADHNNTNFHSATQHDDDNMHQLNMMTTRQLASATICRSTNVNQGRYTTTYHHATASSALQGHPDSSNLFITSTIAST